MCTNSLSILVLAGGTAEETGTTGSNETSLLTGRSVAGHGRGVTNVLVVTTTVGVVDGVHSNTTSTGPAVALGAHGVVLPAGLEEGLVDTATTGDDTDDGTAAGRDNLLGAGGETDTGLAVLTVANDGGVVARGTGERSTVTNLLLDVADNGTFRALGDGEDVADVEGGLLAAVDERAGRDTLSSDEGLLAELVAVRVTEDDGGEGGAAGVSKGVIKGVYAVCVGWFSGGCDFLQISRDPIWSSQGVVQGDNSVSTAPLFTRRIPLACYPRHSSPEPTPDFLPPKMSKHQNLQISNPSTTTVLQTDHQTTNHTHRSITLTGQRRG